MQGLQLAACMRPGGELTCALPRVAPRVPACLLACLQRTLAGQMLLVQSSDTSSSDLYSAGDLEALAQRCVQAPT